jgi:hypothetical protein
MAKPGLQILQVFKRVQMVVQVAGNGDCQHAGAQSDFNRAEIFASTNRSPEIGFCPIEDSEIATS